MKNSQKRQKFAWFGFLTLGILIGIIIAGVYLDKNIEEVIVEIEKEQPMLMLISDSWGENIENSEELIFRYWIYNFGNVEAKSLTIVCELSLDQNQDYVVWEENYTIGNIASNSNKYQESYMMYYENVDDYYGSCRLISADGEYINLVDRIYDI